MKGFLPISKSRGLCLAALVSVAGYFQASSASAQSSFKGVPEQTLLLEQRAQMNYDVCILDRRGGLKIELLDLPELSGRFSIGPDGTLCLPRLRALYMERLIIEELRWFLTQQFKANVRDSHLYVRPMAYQPIRLYVTGEVKPPSYYTLSSDRKLSNLSSSAKALPLQAGTATTTTRTSLGQLDQSLALQGTPRTGWVFLDPALSV